MKPDRVGRHNLWIGAAPFHTDRLSSKGFDDLVLCAFEHQPPDGDFPGVRVIRCPFDDDDVIHSPQMAMIAQTSRNVAKALKQSRRVLVSCHMGLNRSGLVAGLALRCLGVPGDRAVRLIRAARGQYALCNALFEKLVREARP